MLKTSKVILKCDKCGTSFTAARQKSRVTTTPPCPRIDNKSLHPEPCLGKLRLVEKGGKRGRN